MCSRPGAGLTRTSPAAPSVTRSPGGSAVSVEPGLDLAGLGDEIEPGLPHAISVVVVTRPHRQYRKRRVCANPFTLMDPTTAKLLRGCLASRTDDPGVTRDEKPLVAGSADSFTR